MNDWTFGISIYAAIVATLALGWKIVEFMLSGRRLVLDTAFDQTFIYHDVPGPDGEREAPIEWCSFEVTLRSVGRQSLTVESCRIEFRGRDEAIVAVETAPFPVSTGDEDSPWPMRLEAGESRVLALWRAPEAIPATGTEFRASARLGTGKRVVSPWRRIAREAPSPGHQRSRP